MAAEATTFVIDCPWCKAKVAATEKGCAHQAGFDDEGGEPYGYRIQLGECPKCHAILVGESVQIDFAGLDAEEDRWSDIVRVHPKPPKTFSSLRIPRVVKDSLTEADRAMQAGANIAACVMLGRALEALCRDLLEPVPTEELLGSPETETEKKPKRPVMLGAGIKKLKDRKIIDERLFDWSQELQAFRNLAAHPEDISISRRDTEDLQSFVNAIVEYVYDLADRYDDFKKRLARGKRKR